MNNKIKILHLEDSLNDSEIIRSIIDHGGIEYEYFLVDNEKDFIRTLETENIEIILSDYSLPDYNGNEALKVAKERFSNVSFIYVSGMMGEDAAINAMLNGATDYVLKNKLVRLVPAIKRALHEQELEIKRKQSEINLREKNELIEAQNQKYIQINKELVLQNEEKEKRAKELILANNELAYQNIEKEKRAEELIVAKEHAEESSRLKSAFLANMSHEIRTPLNGIIGFSQIIRNPNITEEEKKDFLDGLDKSSQRLIDLINNLIDISLVDSGQMEIKKRDFFLNDLLMGFYEIYNQSAMNKNIKLNVDLGLNDEDSIYESDETIIFKIMDNLINNAVKFTKSGKIDFGYRAQNDEFIFYVRDTGIGISENDLSIIFDRFRQIDYNLSRSYEGSGIGLSLAKGLIKLLNGGIWVESEPDKGSTFYFTLPKTKAA